MIIGMNILQFDGKKGFANALPLVFKPIQQDNLVTCQK